MMRPTCAYPTIVQHGPDVYGDREAFGMMQMQQVPPVQGFYSVGPTGGGPVGMLSSSSPPTYNSQVNSLSMPTYTSIPMQVSYSNANGADVLTPAGQMAATFHHHHQQQQQQYHQSMIPSNNGAMISRGPNSSHPTSVAVQFANGQTLMQASVPRLPGGPARARSASTNRSQIPIGDANGYPPQPMYAASYTTPASSCSLPATADNSVPYSMAFPCQSVASPTANKPSVQLTSTSTLVPQPSTPNLTPRSTNTLSNSCQQPAMFGTQSPRQLSVGPTGYQSRSGTVTPQGSVMIPRSQPDCSTMILPSKEQNYGPNGTQIAGAGHPCTSPNSSMHFLQKGNTRSGGAFGQYPNVVGFQNSITPPGGIVINGPMGQSAMMATMNGCVNVGTDGDVKNVSCPADACFNIQHRPMSSGSRDLAVSAMPVTGPLGSGSELLISPTFPVSNNLSGQMNLPYTGNPQQIFPGDFDSLSSNPSPMMMMAMPVSSPIPGGPLLNGGLPPGMMNMTPAPPPYHQPSASLMNCRPLCPSFFNHPQMSNLPTSAAFHAISSSGGDAERHFMSTTPENTITGKRTPTGSTKSTPRAKRSRTTKNAGGTGRGSKANSKKSSSATSCAPPTMAMQPMMDPFAMNARMNSQMAARARPVGWAPQNGPMGFSPCELTSPPVSMDGRQNCASPMTSFNSTNGVLMRPNSGPPVNASFGSSIQGNHVVVSKGPGEMLTRPPASPRLYQSVNCQQPLCTSGSMVPSIVSVRPPFGSQPTNSHSGQPIQTNRTTPQQLCPTRNAAFVKSDSSNSDHLVSSSSPGSCPSGPCIGPDARVSNFSDTDRLVCPITNGMVWGPMQIHLNDVMHQFIPDGIVVRRFEFELTANHLNTIVGRSDLDIVVCSHLLNEPLQVCHWPSDAVQIRFNEYHLRLDRSSVNTGQSAHKVACVKQLCRPGRNQLEIAIIGLGEDPNSSATIAKRREVASSLETHRFAAFMAHMPALNVLLDGLKRRRPAGVSALCDLLEARARSRPEGSGPVVEELNLICPVFRTRMNVPGRITGCEHVEAFDMEAFLRREVLWPRLNCPICGHKSPAGLDGLCIDITILYAMRLVPATVDRILVRSDGYWRLPPPHCLDLPNDLDQWQPLIGPLTEAVSHALMVLNCPRDAFLFPDAPRQSSSPSPVPRSKPQSTESFKDSSLSPHTVRSVSPALRDRYTVNGSASCVPTSRPLSQPVTLTSIVSAGPVSTQQLRAIPLGNSSVLSSDSSSQPHHSDVQLLACNPVDDVHNPNRVSGSDESFIPHSRLESTDKFSPRPNSSLPTSSPSGKVDSDSCSSQLLNSCGKSSSDSNSFNPEGGFSGENKSASSLNKGLDFLLGHDAISDVTVSKTSPTATLTDVNSLKSDTTIESAPYKQCAIDPRNGYDSVAQSNGVIDSSNCFTLKKVKLENDPELTECVSMMDHHSSNARDPWPSVKSETHFHEKSLQHKSQSLYGDELLCIDAIHSLSAQIDRIEIFLEDSYLRFVEKFPCK